MIVIMSTGLDAHLSALPSSESVFDEGRFLFHRGDPVRKMFVVVEGAVHLIRSQRNGATIILQRAGAGDLLAEASLFSDRYHCDAVAVAPARVRRVARSAVLASLERRAGFAAAFAEHLGRQVQDSRLRAEILSLKTVTQRLDAWLVGHDGKLPAKGDWKRVAMEIGVSPEALYRELARRRT